MMCGEDRQGRFDKDLFRGSYGRKFVYTRRDFKKWLGIKAEN